LAAVAFNARKRMSSRLWSFEMALEFLERQVHLVVRLDCHKHLQPYAPQRHYNVLMVVMEQASEPSGAMWRRIGIGFPHSFRCEEVFGEQVARELFAAQ
jgi:hypothetical protein